MSHRDFYPRWITLPTGQQMIVQTHQQLSALLGQEFDECARPVNCGPKPPTLDEVVAAGYSPEVAMKIVAEEQRKADFGIQPYGDKTEEAMPAPEPIAAETSDAVEEEQFTEPFYPPAAEQQAEDVDPLGIFEPGAAEEPPVDPAAAPEKPAKRRAPKSKE